jgi:hypothetical protein
MAVIGDILVKFVADFAQFATNMTDATRQIGAFGQKLDDQNSLLQRHGTTLSNVAKTLADLGKSGSVDQFTSKLDGLGASLGRLGVIGAAAAAAIGAVTYAISKVREVEDYALAVDDLQKNFKLTSEQAQVLQLAAQRTGVSAEDLRKRIEAIPGEWQRLINAARSQNLLRDNLDDAAKASKGLSAAWDDFLLSLQPSGTVIAAITATLRGLTAVVHGLATALDEVTKVRTVDQSTLTPDWLKNNPNAYARAYPGMPTQPADPYGLNAYAALARQQAFARSVGQPGFAATPGFAQGALIGAPIQFPAMPTFGDEAERLKHTLTPTTPTGGGKTDEDNINAQIKRYTALADAAQKTSEKISEFHATNIEDFQRELKVQQQVDEIAGKLGAKYDQASDAAKEQLRSEITLYETRRSENEKWIEAAQKAADVERKYGDGTAAAAKSQSDFERAQKTGIATQQALTRARKADSEAIEQARLEAKRYDDDLGSLAAGFEHAANAYARSNDLYSQGAQTFDAITSAMGEGLDALEGKSSKTFGQIASDFASMLARMALQAATSQVFKWAFGSILGAAPTTAPAGYADFSGGSLTDYFARPRAGGGPVDAGQSYLVGEYGPERFVPAAAGRVEPMRASDSSGSVTVNLDMGQVQGASNPGSALEFGRRVKAAVVDVIQQEKRPGGTLYSRANA